MPSSLLSAPTSRPPNITPPCLLAETNRTRLEKTACLIEPRPVAAPPTASTLCPQPLPPDERRLESAVRGLLLRRRVSAAILTAGVRRQILASSGRDHRTTIRTPPRGLATESASARARLQERLDGGHRLLPG